MLPWEEILLEHKRSIRNQPRAPFTSPHITQFGTFFFHFKLQKSRLLCANVPTRGNLEN